MASAIKTKENGPTAVTKKKDYTNAVETAKTLSSFVVNTEKMFRAADSAKIFPERTFCHIPSEHIDGHSGAFRVNQFVAGWFLYKNSEKAKEKALKLEDRGGVARATTDSRYAKAYMVAAVPRAFKDSISFWNFVAPKSAVLSYTPATTAAAIHGVTIGSVLAVGNLAAVTLFVLALLVKAGVDAHRSILCSNFAKEIENKNEDDEDDIEYELNGNLKDQAGIEKLKRRIGEEAFKRLTEGDRSYLVKDGDGFKVRTLQYGVQNNTLGVVQTGSNIKVIRNILIEGANKTAEAHTKKAIALGLFGFGVLIILVGMFLAFFSTPVPILGLVGSIIVWTSAAYSFKNLCDKYSLGTKIKSLFSHTIPEALSRVGSTVSSLFQASKSGQNPEATNHEGFSDGHPKSQTPSTNPQASNDEALLQFIASQGWNGPTPQ